MNLDKLLADALRDAHNLKHAGKTLHQSIQCSLIHREAQHRYGPQSWISSRLIELVWSPAPGHTPSSLGFFRELLHKSGSGRRLSPVPERPRDEAFEVEFCYGEHWVEAHRAADVTETSVHEILELRERFEELMREVEMGL